jgi:ATP-dependent RNA helicase DeaD
MQKKLFSDLGLSPEILKAVSKMGFEEASPIQSAAIPKMLAGADIVGESQTGSGKTAAFAIPAIERVDAALRAPQVLIVCPTRELTMQVAEEVAKLALFKRGVRELPIYGGQAYDRQLRGLREGAQIIIGTPGRLIDHLKRGTLHLDQVRMVVLDEADRMLDMGFRDDIEAILKSAPPARQTVFFSATLPPPIQQLIRRYARTPVIVRIEAHAMTVPAIEQVYYEVDPRSKLEALCRLIDLQDIKYALIFCGTKMMVDELAEHLAARGYSCDKLHGGIAQAMRERVMAKFRKRGFEFLVATDVAARGLDVEDIEVVFNYDLPHDAEDYVHRIGRTGRAGRSGKAITFVAGREIYKMQQIMRFMKGRVRRERVPSAEQVEEKRTTQFVETLRETLEKGEYQRYDEVIDQLLEQGHSPTDIASALIDILARETAREMEPIIEVRPHVEARPHVGTRSRPDYARPRGTAREPALHGARPGTRERGATSPVSHEAGMTRLVLNVGKAGGVGPGDVVGVIAGLAGLSREDIGAIQLLPQQTFVDVADASADLVVKKLKGIKFKGRKLAIGRAG